MSKIEILLEQLKGFPKTYFSKNDLEKFYPGKDKNIGVVLNRLVKRKKIIRLIRGFYTFNLSSLDLESLSCEILTPAYISLEYALWRYGMMNEIPARITLITTKKSRLYTFSNNTFEYSHFNPTLFFGYKIEKNILIAEKEKAFLDEIYLISLKKRSLNLKNINLSSLDKKLIKKLVKNYPLFTRKLLKTYLS